VVKSSLSRSREYKRGYWFIQRTIFGMHLTLGHAVVKFPEGLESGSLSPQIKKDYIEHSNYILECCKEFNLLSNDVRIPLSEHDS
jgi:hypothetical protein